MLFSFLKVRPKVERILVSDPYFNEIARFRYKTYCEELNFLDTKKYIDQKETDEYDGQSVHIVVRVGKDLGGYARVIFPGEKNNLPIFDNFKLNITRSNHSCEISRFIISKKYRQNTNVRRKVFQILVNEIKAVMNENNIFEAYAVIEDWLKRSLEKRGVYLAQIGNGKNYMGAVTYPVKIKIHDN